MTYIDPHVTLGLRRGASAAEVNLQHFQILRDPDFLFEWSQLTMNPFLNKQIKDAYRRLCLQHHPDLCPPAQKAAAERYFKEISSAYQQLSRRTFLLISTAYALLHSI